MADFSKITSPTGAEFVVKDTTARADISTLTSTVAGKITNPSGGTAGQVLTKTANGEAWATPSGGGNVDTVNGISPDANKNVQTSVELTQAQYEALPSSKLTDNVEYFLTDGENNPLNNTVMASGVAYDNTESGMSANNLQDAVDELKGSLTHEPDLLYTVTGNVTGQTLAHSIADYRVIRFVITNSDEGRIFSTSDVQLSLARAKVFAANITAGGTWNTRRISFPTDTTITVADSTSPDNIHILVYGVK